MAIVYQHIRKDTNDVFYIGIGKTNKRAYSFKNRNKYWRNIVNKCGYDIDIIETDLKWEDACIKEKELISLYGRIDLGTGTLVNMTDGGDGVLGLIFSDEAKRKIGEGNKNKVQSDEAKRKIGLASKGNKYCLGKPRSEEVKRKISEGLKGRICSEETRRKIGLAHKGKFVSEEVRKKLSESHKGYVHTEEQKRKNGLAHRGMKRSEETKRKMKEAWQIRKNKIIC
jgi:hypothetical protein